MTEKDLLANPAPLGLMGFGMTTVLLNLFNASILTSASMGMILGMGMFYGGLAQVIAGVMEFKKGNTFGTTAFTSYGLFWLSLVAILVIPALGWAGKVDALSMAAYLFMWGLFTTYMFIGTLKKNRALQFIFGTLALLFFLLAIADYTGSSMIKTIAAYEGVICGLSAIYLACAEVLNDSYGKNILPV
jgi:hypothetical protein